ALIAPCAVVAPVPPLPTASVPVTSALRSTVLATVRVPLPPLVLTKPFVVSVENWMVPEELSPVKEPRVPVMLELPVTLIPPVVTDSAPFKVIPANVGDAPVFISCGVDSVMVPALLFTVIWLVVPWRVIAPLKLLRLLTPPAPVQVSHCMVAPVLIRHWPLVPLAR